MSDIDFEHVRAVFIAVRDLDESARSKLLQQHCQSNAALRAEIESLLAHHDVQHAHPTTPAVNSAIGALFKPDVFIEETLPRPFGDFQLLDVIGRGGMGVVYRAQQRTPDRIVALKVIRAGMMSASMLDRFRYEADLLARLQHPGIAQIFEAGAVQSGRSNQPYFAMEFVSGRAIDSFATHHNLNLRLRLELFAKVCDAVHHAHQKGVIHRDLKPGNILVDATGQPKILDFGVARATDADLRATTMRTNVGQLIGTLPYMSPEQISGDPARLDVRSDVYALGVLMFELLTGRLPHDIHEKTLADAALAIRDGEHTRLSAISQDLRGDLDTIAGAALAKDPARRYQSAAALAEDIRRYLTNQPITARPASAMYHLRLFARRHKPLVAGAAMAVVALVLAATISIVFGIRSQQSATREAKQRTIAQRTNDHLLGMLALPDPHRQGGGDITLAEMLEQMVKRLDEQHELPEVEAQMRSAIGTTYLNQRRAPEAIVQLSRAVELWRTIEPQGTNLAESLMRLGLAKVHAGDGEPGEAAYREALALFEQLGADELDGVRGGFLDVLIRRKKLDEAAQLAEQLMTPARQNDNPITLIGRLRQLMRINHGRGAYDAALANLAEAQALVNKHLPPDHAIAQNIWLDISVIRQAKQDWPAALEASTAAYGIATRRNNPGTSDWITCLNFHIAALKALDRRDEAISVLTQARESLEAAHGADHPQIAVIDAHLAKFIEQPQ